MLCGGREGAGEEARVEACSFSEGYCFSFSQLTLSRSGHIKYSVFTEKYFTGWCCTNKKEYTLSDSHIVFSTCRVYTNSVSDLSCSHL